MGYNDSRRPPRIDEVAYVLESGKQGAPWLKGTIVGVDHEGQSVLVKTEGRTGEDPNASKLIKANTTNIMFGQDANVPPNNEPAEA